MEVFDKTGASQTVGAEIARGGEGAVLGLVAKSSVVIKLFHPALLLQRGVQLREKVEAMVALRTRFDTSSLAWPAISIYGDDGGWIGYAMRRASGISLAKLAHPMLCKKYLPDLDRRDVVGLLVNLIETIDRLHCAGIYLGDINLNNFLYDPEAKSVTLIDCDSYQIVVDGCRFPCLVGAADMIPPEHHAVNLGTVDRTRESDLFSLGILIFRCLMLGRHPYDFVGGGTVVENLRGGHFPYGAGGVAPGRAGAIPEGPWYLIWSHLSFELKSLFIRSLSVGAGTPSQRALATEWLHALEKYYAGLDRGHHDTALRPLQLKSRERKGALATAY